MRQCSLVPDPMGRVSLWSHLDETRQRKSPPSTCYSFIKKKRFQYLFWGHLSDELNRFEEHVVICRTQVLSTTLLIHRIFKMSHEQ